MDIVETPVQFELAGPETLVELKKNPPVATLFLNLFFLSMIRPSTLDDDTCISRVRVVRNNLKPDTKKKMNEQKKNSLK